MRDLILNSTQALAPGAPIKASVNGTGIDTVGYNGVLLIVNAGVITDGTHTLSVEDSPDNATWTAVDPSLLIGAFTPLTSISGGGATQEVGYIGGNRYVRVISTVTGSPATGGSYDASAVLGFASVKTN